MKPPSANAVSLAFTGETVSAAAPGSFSRTPMIDRPMPVRRKWPATASTMTKRLISRMAMGPTLTTGFGMIWGTVMIELLIST